MYVTSGDLGATTNNAQGLSLVNGVTATSSTLVEVSPPLVWHGSAWNASASPAAATTVDFRAYQVPLTTNPITALLVLANQVGTGSFNNGNQIVFSTTGYMGLGRGTAPPLTYLHLNGGMALGIIFQTSSYAMNPTDAIVTASAASGALTITLPSAFSITGQLVHIKKTDSSANTVTVAALSASEGIQTLSSVALTHVFASLTLYSNGNGQWLVMTST
jgi:hypothetical protein